MVSKKRQGRQPWKSHVAQVTVSPVQWGLRMPMGAVRVLPSAAGRRGSAPARCTSPLACCSAARWLGLSLYCHGHR